MAIIRLLGSSLIDSGPGHIGHDVFDKFIKLLEDIMGACFCIFLPSDIRGNIIFLKGSFALCLRVFSTLVRIRNSRILALIGQMWDIVLYSVFCLTASRMLELFHLDPP